MPCAAAACQRYVDAAARTHRRYASARDLAANRAGLRRHTRRRLAGCDGHGAAPHGALERRRPGAPAQFCGRAAGAAVVAAIERAGDRQAVGPFEGGRASTGLQLARLRREHAFQANRFHTGQPFHQPRVGSAGFAPAGGGAARTRDRLVLRPGQLHAAPGLRRA